MKSTSKTTGRLLVVLIGFAVLAGGVVSRSWWAVLGLVPLLIPTIDWVHGLFTFRELRF